MLAALVLLPACQSAIAAAPAQVERSEHGAAQGFAFNKHGVIDAVTAYEFRRDVCLPLGELERLSDPGSPRRTRRRPRHGYLLAEQRTFSLDVQAPDGEIAAAANGSTAPRPS